MAVSDYSTNPALNVTINGIDISEGCSPANINNALRQMMADTKGLLNDIPVASSFMPISGGTFTGTQPRYSGSGALLHHNNSANGSGRVFFLAQGSPNPSSPTNGDIVLFFAP